MKNVSKIWLAAAAFLLVASAAVNGQPRSDYARLAFENNRPEIFVDVVPLPGDTDNELQLTAFFKIGYSFLPFKKTNASSGDSAFMSSTALSMEVFNAPRKKMKPREEVDVKKLTSVARTSWQDTVYAGSYEQTKAPGQYLNGSLQIPVMPGTYSYFLNLSRNDDIKGNNSRTQNIRVEPYRNQKKQAILFGSAIDSSSAAPLFTLQNLGNNVRYGEDFYALIHLSNYNADVNYSYSVNKIELSRKDTTKISSVASGTILPEQISQNTLPKVANTKGEPALRLTNSTNGYAYALVKIPNATFENDTYRLIINRDDSPQPVAASVFQSYWSTMPVSLLSLDVAIDMLQFMADKATIKNIDDGSDREREQKFRAFWKQRDPTPNTEFNELQAEYYRRIDYTYQNFGSQNIAGFNTDRGKVYINYGPPNDVKRSFPAGGQTTEVWTYPNRNFVFKATSGFGDFELISNQ